MTHQKRYTAEEMSEMSDLISEPSLTRADIRNVSSFMLRQAATDAERLESLEEENARLRGLLAECAELLSKTPPVCNDIYVGKKLEIRFGVEAARLSNIARNALKEGDV